MLTAMASVQASCFSPGLLQSLCPPSPWSPCLESTLIHLVLCSHKSSVYMMLFPGLDSAVLIHGLSLVIWTSRSSPPASCIPLTHMCSPPAVCYVFIPLSLSMFCFPCLEYHSFPLLFFAQGSPAPPRLGDATGRRRPGEELGKGKGTVTAMASLGVASGLLEVKGTGFGPPQPVPPPHARVNMLPYIGVLQSQLVSQR